MIRPLGAGAPTWPWRWWRALLDGRTVDGDGEFFRFRDGKIRPVPDPPVPLVVGGRSNAALERAGRLGDGWLAAWCLPRRFAEGVARVEEVGAGRGVDWQHGLQLWLGVGESPAEGRSYVAETMERFYRMSFEPFERYTPCGTAADVAGFLQPYVDAGGGDAEPHPLRPRPRHRDRDSRRGQATAQSLSREAHSCSYR